MEDENGLQWLSNVALEFKGWIFLGVILVITMITYCISLLSLNQEEETAFHILSPDRKQRKELKNIVAARKLATKPSTEKIPKAKSFTKDASMAANKPIGTESNNGKASEGENKDKALKKAEETKKDGNNNNNGARAMKESNKAQENKPAQPKIVITRASKTLLDEWTVAGKGGKIVKPICKTEKQKVEKKIPSTVKKVENPIKMVENPIKMVENPIKMVE